jgi:hypothetical protein
MKSVVAFAVALVFVCSSVLAANTTTKTTKTNTTGKTSVTSTSTSSMTTGKTTGKTTTTGSSQSNWTPQEMMKVSSEGFDAMRAIREARVAIFNGRPSVATELLNKAKSSLETAAKDAPTFVTTTQTSVNGTVVGADMTVANMNWVPIDGQVSLADAYTASPKKSQHIKNANEHFKNGQCNKAIEELRLAAIDVTWTRVMMSLNTTTKCVNEATTLLNQQKYYQANLALKTAEDALVIDSANLLAVPHKNTSNATTGNKMMPTKTWKTTTGKGNSQMPSKEVN